MRKAVVNSETNVVVNTIVLNEGSDWQVPDGCYLVDADNGGKIGDTWDGEQFGVPKPKKKRLFAPSKKKGK